MSRSTIWRPWRSGCTSPARAFRSICTFPSPRYETARRLCEANHAQVSEVWTYRPGADGFDLVRMSADPSAVRVRAPMATLGTIAPKPAPPPAVAPPAPVKVAPPAPSPAPVKVAPPAAKVAKVKTPPRPVATAKKPAPAKSRAAVKPARKPARSSRKPVASRRKPNVAGHAATLAPCRRSPCRSFDTRATNEVTKPRT